MRPVVRHLMNLCGPRALLLALALLFLPASGHAADEVETDVPVRVDDLQSMGVSVQAINDFVYKIEGEGAMFLINTAEGILI